MQSRRSHSPTFEPSEEQIQHCAYFLWEEMGRPEGRDLEIWDAARERLKHLLGASRSGPKSKPGARRLTRLNGR